jgi:cellulose synthase/poly-beta-1,6-N-acetylglucosamine synthase-like glycosyltransferase
VSSKPSDSHPAVSVVLAARNAAETIAAQLEALAGQTYAGPYELVFVDDGSCDATPVIVDAWKGRLPDVRTVTIGQRQAAGTAGRPLVPRQRTAHLARNVGVRHSRGELLLFCDADDVVDREWIQRMVAGLQRYPAVGGRIERALLNDEAALAARPGRPDGLSDGGFAFLPYPIGANSGLRRDVWDRLGGFRESYDGSSEDVELFWRVQLAGCALGYVSDAVVHYRLRTSVLGMAAQAYIRGRSHARLYRDFAPFGMPRSSLRSVLREWAWLATHTPNLARDRNARAVWASRLALRVGRIVGSGQNRGIYL